MCGASSLIFHKRHSACPCCRAKLKRGPTGSPSPGRVRAPTYPPPQAGEGQVGGGLLGSGAGLVVVADLVGGQHGRVDRDFIETAIEERRGHGVVLSNL